MRKLPAILHCEARHERELDGPRKPNPACVGHLELLICGYRFSCLPQPHWQFCSRQRQAFFLQPQEQVPQSQVPQQLDFVFGVAFVSDMVVLLEFNLRFSRLHKG